MSFGAIAGAAIAVGGSLLAGKKSADAQVDAVETPTRTTGIDQSLAESLQKQTSDSSTAVLEEIFGKEFVEQISKSQETQEQTGTTDQTGQETIQRGDEATQDALSGLIGDLQGDSDARMQAAMNQVLESGMPAVSNVGARSGSFDSTTAALLQNDLATEAAAAGLAAEDAQRQQLLDAIAAGQSGTEQSDTSQSTEEQLQSILDSINESTSDTTSEQTRDAQEDTTTDTTTEVTEEQRNVSDAISVPNDSVKPTGDLADLVDQGNLNELVKMDDAETDEDGNTNNGTGATDIEKLIEEALKDKTGINNGGSGSTNNDKSGDDRNREREQREQEARERQERNEQRENDKAADPTRDRGVGG